MKILNWKQIAEELPPEECWKKFKGTGVFILDVEFGEETLKLEARVIGSEPEVISPLSTLQSIVDSKYYGVTLTSSGASAGDTLEDKIRQIVREEIAAHEERLEVKSIKISGKEIERAVVDSLNSIQREVGKTPLPI
ncbi:hypothetical protein J2T12_005115 [Paenibacillus anaericanus]|uniref:hypothetical protein n=1 Tax=Paenibacillus anaericanus TaxID=170367 RepID=UPI0027847F02|nr:hypothetical protein [Paenibacillus anaericanus]MDQ0091675.1 hypothetical protein [Paenibacillus anaericanus]